MCYCDYVVTIAHKYWIVSTGLPALTVTSVRLTLRLQWQFLGRKRISLNWKSSDRVTLSYLHSLTVTLFCHPSSTVTVSEEACNWILHISLVVPGPWCGIWRSPSGPGGTWRGTAWPRKRQTSAPPLTRNLSHPARIWSDRRRSPRAQRPLRSACVWQFNRNIFALSFSLKNHLGFGWRFPTPIKSSKVAFGFRPKLQILKHGPLSVSAETLSVDH